MVVTVSVDYGFFPGEKTKTKLSATFCLTPSALNSSWHPSILPVSSFITGRSSTVHCLSVFKMNFNWKRLQDDTVIFVKCKPSTTKDRCHPSPNLSIVQCAYAAMIVLLWFFYTAGYKKGCVFTENIKVPRGLFHDIPLDSCA